MRQETIVMPYIGDLSVNHRLGKRRSGGFYVKKSVRDWNEEFGWKIKPLHLEDWKLPLLVVCSGVFKDETKAPDLHNLTKILDVIQEVSGINDKNMKWRDGYRTISPKEINPYLLITIAEAGNDTNLSCMRGSK